MIRIQKLISDFLENNSSTPNSRTLFVRDNIDEINDITSFLPKNSKIIERLYIIQNNLSKDDIVCPMCDNNRKFYTFTSGYNLTCSQSCSTKYQQRYLVDREEVSKKANKTKKKFSTERKDEIRKKRHETMVDKYGETYAIDFGKIGYKTAVTNGTFVSGFSIMSKEERKVTALKIAQTLKNDIDDKGNNHYDRIHIQKLNDIDENGDNFYQRQHLQKLNDIDENGSNHYDRVKLSNYDSGLWTKPEDKDDLEMYRWLVHRTMLKFKNEIQQLPNYDKRGHANKGMYHLDHKFSIIEGFEQNIPPYIIGSIYNLEMIIGRNNLSKNRKCSISKEELFKNFFENYK